MTIAEANRRIQRLNLKAQLPGIISSTSAAIIKYNQNQLYDFSIDSTSNPLEFYKSLAYSIEKNTRNPKPGLGRPDLKDTGTFYNGWFVELQGDILKIYSRDSKTPELVGKYGDDIFGLTKENKTRYSFGEFFEKVKEYVTATTGFKFR